LWVLKKHIHPQRKRSSIWVCIGETTTFPSMKNMKINLRVAWRKVTFPLHQEIQFKLHCIVVSVSISYRNELVFCKTRTFQQNKIALQTYLFILFIWLFLVLTQIRRIYCILQIASYYYPPLVEIHLILKLFQHVMSLIYEHVLSN
jgi:hypothetical protein